MAFDAANAVIVRHVTPAMGGARPISAGQGISSSAGAYLDYIERRGQWEEKGGCDRSYTLADEELMQRSRSLMAGRQLDYVSREGRWEHKGEERMVDCSFFGQNGAVAREEVEADMLRSGGCYVRSLVTVRREDAAMLGLDSKEGFESLLRATWRESCLAWGVTDNLLDVHWVANYHTDQENNLHCHVTTWFAEGCSFDAEGWTVSAAATRQQREIVYKHAYAEVMREQVYPMKDFARERAILQAKAELGIPVTDRQLARLHNLAVASGSRPPTIIRTVQTSEPLERRIERMREVHDEGSGRKGSSHKLQAAARDVHKELLEASPAYKQAFEDYRAQVEIQADAKGLAVRTAIELEPEQEMDTTAQEVTQHLRDDYVRSQMNEFVQHRLVPAIEQAASPDLAARELVKEAVKEAVTWREAVSAASTKPEISSIEPEQGKANAVSLANNAEPAAEAIAQIIVKTPEVSERIEQAASRICEKLAECGVTANHDNIKEQITEQAAKRAETILGSSAQKIVSREMDARTAEVVREVRGGLSAAVFQAATKNDGLSLGLSRAEAAELKVALTNAGRLMAQGAMRNDPAVQAELKAAAAIIVASPIITAKLSEVAPEYASLSRRSVSSAMQELGDKVADKISHHLEKQAPKVYERSMSAPAMEQQPVQTPFEPTHDYRAIAGNLAGMLAQGLTREFARQAATPVRKRPERDQQELQINPPTRSR